MKTPFLLSLLLACCCLALVASPALAAEAAETPTEPEIAVAYGEDSSDCRTSAVLFGDSALGEAAPLAGCFVFVECDDESMVSCTGNSTCTTSGPSDRCVTCDGQQQGCCEKTCCEQCQDNLNNCLQTCGPFGFPPNCDACHTIYSFCVGNCTGGC